MAFWDGKQINYFPSEPIKEYPDWLWIDCGCCVGIKWGGEYPIICDKCEGNGVIAKHKPSGILSLYPGGPFKGKEIT